MNDAPLFIDYCPKDFIDGCILLDPWEELAYRRVCDFIYLTNDRLPDDDRKLAAMTKVGNRWIRIKANLVAAGKLAVVDGRLTNGRCQKTLEKVQARRTRQSTKGKASAEKRKSLKNNKSPPTADEPQLEPRSVPQLEPRYQPKPITQKPNYPPKSPHGGTGDDGVWKGRTRAAWRAMLIAFRDRNFWPLSAGPEPGYSGCDAPPDLVAEILGTKPDKPNREDDA